VRQRAAAAYVDHRGKIEQRPALLTLSNPEW